MRLPARRARLHPEALAALGLARGDRVLAFQEVGEGTLVATAHRVAVVDSDGRPVVSRPWHDVDSAVWDDEAKAMRVSWVDGSPAWSFTVPSPDRDLMTTIRARVQSTLVAMHSSTIGARTVRVMLRRDLASGELFFQYQYGQGLRTGDPRVESAVRALEERLRDDAGLPPDFTSGA